ncbi:MAG: aldo/keto reductase [Dehalococcoidia bacterium]|nr:aldo/keto reductase [Dehalococcoidia bacterium]
MSEQMRDIPEVAALRPYMTRVKAIEVLQQRLTRDCIDLDPDFDDALRLAIDALQKAGKPRHVR